MATSEEGRNACTIKSILDTDLYKLTMQCAIRRFFPHAHVSYAYTNRTPQKKLNRKAFEWLQSQVEKLGDVVLQAEEYDFLKKNCGYLDHEDYLDYLKSFRFHPTDHVHLDFVPVDGGDGDQGDVRIRIDGLWVDTILYEIPLLALTSESYFKFCDRSWSHEGQEERAYQKGIELIENGCAFSEFGTRRRRDYETQLLVLRGLVDASLKLKDAKGKLTGTSNVHFAMKYGIPPVGTVAHEWFMGIAAATNNYETVTETGLEYWIQCFGIGVLGIALTDTFGTPTFLKAFSAPIPKSERAITDGWLKGQVRSYADVFAGVRQDSGNPKAFIKTMRDYYNDHGLTNKTLVFSDSLNVERAIEYRKLAEEAGFIPAFGIGTFLTNDYKQLDTDKKSEPLNIVIKLSSAEGRHAVKLSDDMGKNTGDPAIVQQVKERLGYVDRHWDGANEDSRWSGKDGR